MNADYRMEYMSMSESTMLNSDYGIITYTIFLLLLEICDNISNALQEL